MHVDDFYKMVEEILPTASIETDNEGQIVIYTGLQYSDKNDEVELKTDRV